MELKEIHIIEEIKNSNRRIFSALFDLYYKNLVLYAGSIVGNREESEDIVQSLFVKLWEERERLSIDTSIKAYLMRAVRNGCLDALRHREVAMEHHDYVLATNKTSDADTELYILHSDLSKQLDRALEQLPASCREVFRLNRLEGIKQREVAEQLGISLRTVEERLSKSVRLLSQLLHEFRALLW